MHRLLIHVGFPKTATTTLQDHLFAKHGEITYLGKPFSGELWEIEQQVLTLDSYLFEGRLPALQEMARQKLETFPNGNLLISHEGFLRNSRYGGHDLGRTARRLRAVFGAALGPEGQLEIIVCLRNQVDLILSHYIQFIKGSQKDFDRYLTAELESPDSGFTGSLFYDQLLTFLSAEFGRENLHILLFEELLSDWTGFITKLSAILEIDADESLALLAGKHEKQKSSRRQAYLTDGRGSLAKRLTRMLAAKITVRPPQRDAIEDLYRECNTRLANSFGLLLRDAGYALQPGQPQMIVEAAIPAPSNGLATAGVTTAFHLRPPRPSRSSGSNR